MIRLFVNANKSNVLKKNLFSIRNGKTFNSRSKSFSSISLEEFQQTTTSLKSSNGITIFLQNSETISFKRHFSSSIPPQKNNDAENNDVEKTKITNQSNKPQKQQQQIKIGKNIFFTSLNWRRLITLIFIIFSSTSIVILFFYNRKANQFFQQKTSEIFVPFLVWLLKGSDSRFIQRRILNILLFLEKNSNQVSIQLSKEETLKIFLEISQRTKDVGTDELILKLLLSIFSNQSVLKQNRLLSISSEISQDSSYLRILESMIKHLANKSLALKSNGINDSSVPKDVSELFAIFLSLDDVWAQNLLKSVVGFEVASKLGSSPTYLHSLSKTLCDISRNQKDKKTIFNDKSEILIVLAHSSSDLIVGENVAKTMANLSLSLDSNEEDSLLNFFLRDNKLEILSHLVSQIERSNERTTNIQSILNIYSNVARCLANLALMGNEKKKKKKDYLFHYLNNLSC